MRVEHSPSGVMVGETASPSPLSPPEHAARRTSSPDRAAKMRTRGDISKMGGHSARSAYSIVMVPVIC